MSAERMAPNKTYAMPIEERDGQWRFRVAINGRDYAFGPYITIDAAADIRSKVVERPENCKALGGKLIRVYDLRDRISRG